MPHDRAKQLSALRDAFRRSVALSNASNSDHVSMLISLLRVIETMCRSLPEDARFIAGDWLRDAADRVERLGK